MRRNVSPWTSYQIRKIAGCACAGNAGNVFPRRRFQRKPLVSDPGMHHGTCVTHVPWCMSGSLTCGDGENVPGIPGACAPAILRIWQEAHCMATLSWNQKINEDVAGILSGIRNHLRPTENMSKFVNTHYNDVIMSAMTSQITSLTIVYSTVYSRRRSKKTSKLRVTGLCEGNSPVTGEFPAQKDSNAENVFIWWRHHVPTDCLGAGTTNLLADRHV